MNYKTYQKTNEAHLEELKKVVSDGKAALFVGAGCSIPLGYPSWRKFVDIMLDECCKTPSLKAHIKTFRKEKELLYVAGKCKDYLGNEYYKILFDEFKPKKGKSFTEEHKVILSLPFSRIITSNYDPCLDHALSKVKSTPAVPFTYSNDKLLAEFISKPGDSKNHIFNIHGRYDKPEEIILTESDYQKHYELNGTFTQSLKILFSTTPVVFIGTSMSDLDFIAILRHIGTLFKHYTQGHFALMPYPETIPETEADKLKTKYNITPVFYSVKKKGGHSERQNILEQILKEGITKKPRKRKLATITSEADLITYRRLLSYELSNLRILDMTRPVNLRDVYIRLSLQEGFRPYFADGEDIYKKGLLSASELEALDVGKTSRPPKALTIEKALSDYRKMVILGDPGAGKTTLLKHITLQLAENKVEEIKVLPVYVEIRDYLNKYSFDLFDYLDSELSKKYNFINSKKYLAGECERGNVAFFFDGLDEAAGKTKDESEANYKKVVDIINALSTKYKECYFIVTCRKAGWKGQLSEAFSILNVLEFTPEDVDSYIYRWFSVEIEKAEELTRRLKQRPRIKSLASNPLLLALICITFDRLGGLPDRRVSIYEKCMEVLLKEWDRQRGITRVEEFDQSYKLQLLQEIALQFFVQGKKFFARDELLSVIRGFLPAINILPERDEDILDEISAQYGLLKEQAEGWYGFMHLTLQEYFAACAINESKNYDLIIENIFRPWWEEAILLLAGKGDATALLKTLLEAEDDIFNHNLFLAGRCLAEKPTLRDTALRTKIIEKLKETVRTIPHLMSQTTALDILAENAEKDFLIKHLKNAKMAYVGLTIATALGMRDKTIAPELLAMLKDDNIHEYVRNGIANALGHIGGKVMATELLALLKDGKIDSEVRRSIAYALGDIRDKTMTHELIAMLKDEKIDSRVRKGIAYALIRDKTMTHELIAMLKDEKIDSQVRHGIANALGRLGDKGMVPELLALLKDEKIDSEVRRSIANALGRLGDKGMATELLALLKDDNTHKYVRNGIAYALGRLGDKGMATELLAMLKDDKIDAQVRHGIAYALGDIRDKTMTHELLALLKDEKIDSGVRHGIAYALGTIGEGESICAALYEAIKDDDIKIPVFDALYRVSRRSGIIIMKNGTLQEI